MFYLHWELRALNTTEFEGNCFMEFIVIDWPNVIRIHVCGMHSILFGQGEGRGYYINIR